MTAPKQEKWVYLNKSNLNLLVISSIGAVFDFFSGSVKRAPKWMINSRLEWLYRSIISPIRLGKRNLISNPVFIFNVIKEKLK